MPVWLSINTDSSFRFLFCFALFFKQVYQNTFIRKGYNFKESFYNLKLQSTLRQRKGPIAQMLAQWKVPAGFIGKCVGANKGHGYHPTHPDNYLLTIFYPFLSCYAPSKCKSINSWCWLYKSVTQKTGCQLTFKILPSMFWHCKYFAWDFNTC